MPEQLRLAVPDHLTLTVRISPDLTCLALPRHLTTSCASAGQFRKDSPVQNYSAPTWLAIAALSDNLFQLTHDGGSSSTFCS